MHTEGIFDEQNNSSRPPNARSGRKVRNYGRASEAQEIMAEELAAEVWLRRIEARLYQHLALEWWHIYYQMALQTIHELEK
jgi:hypothetical protein